LRLTASFETKGLHVIESGQVRIQDHAVSSYGTDDPCDRVGRKTIARLIHEGVRKVRYIDQCTPAKVWLWRILRGPVLYFFFDRRGGVCGAVGGWDRAFSADAHQC